VIAVLGLASMLAPSVSSAQTCDAFHAVKPNGQLTPVFSSSSTTDHISFFFQREANRSYSVEVHNVLRDYRDGTYSTNLNTFDCPTSNLAGIRNTQDIEPSPQGSNQDIQRFSFTSTSNGLGEVRAGSTSGTVQLQVSVSDTTLFSNWFFLGADYGSFTLIRNTTAASVAYRINWRSAAGAILATTTGTIAANGSAVANARDFPAAVTAGSGTVEITHDAPPGAIVASTTVISGTTGLSFDAPFATRN
jgi:hypothetical protein